MLHIMAFCFVGLAMVTADKLQVPTVRINTGAAMPVMLWGSGGPTQENTTSTAPAVTLALDTGFPGIDTANHYHNQIGVAAGIKSSRFKTADRIWLQTKVEPCGHSIITPILPGHCYNGTLHAFEQNLQQLDVKVVDLTLIHAPPCIPNSTWAGPMCLWPDQPDAVYPQHCNCAAKQPCSMMQEQWKALEAMLAAGKTRAIGVSNFCRPCLECIAQVSKIVPAVNQLQYHIGMNDKTGLFAYNKAKGIVVQAYSPLGGDDAKSVLDNPTIEHIANSHNKSTAQIALRWVLQQGYPLATSTVRESYMEEDLGVWGWELTTPEMEVLSDLRFSSDDPVKSMCLLD